MNINVDATDRPIAPDTVEVPYRDRRARLRHRQIVVLSIDFDLAKLPAPENWPWQGGAGSVVTLVGASPLRKLEPDASYYLAMEVLQSPLYQNLPTEAKAACDKLIDDGQARL